MSIHKDSGATSDSTDAHFSEKTASFPEMAKNATELGRESGNDLNSVDNRGDVEQFQSAQDAEPGPLGADQTGVWSSTPEGAPDTSDSGPNIVT